MPARAGRCRGRRAIHARGLDVAPAVDHRLRRAAGVGHQLVQGLRESGLQTWNRTTFRVLDKMINKVPPVVAGPDSGARAIPVHLCVVHRHGNACLPRSLRASSWATRRPRLVMVYGRTLRICAISLITISAMLGIGTLTRLLGSRCHARSRLRPCRSALSFLRHAPGLGYGVALTGLRHGIQLCSSATCRKIHLGAAWTIRRS